MVAGIGPKNRRKRKNAKGTTIRRSNRVKSKRRRIRNVKGERRGIAVIVRHWIEGNANKKDLDLDLDRRREDQDRDRDRDRLENNVYICYNNA